MAEKPNTLREWPNRVTSSSNQPARALIVRRQSPEEEAIDFADSPGDAAMEPIAWHPLTWVAEKSKAAYDYLTEIGQAIMPTVEATAKDAANLVVGATAGYFPYPEQAEHPSSATNIILGAVERLPAPVKAALGADTPEEPAGYIEVNGRRIPVPKYKEPAKGAEKQQANVANPRLTDANLSAAVEMQKTRLAQGQLATSNEQWEKLFALQERQAARQDELNQLQIRAAELALERETSSPAQRALWGRPSTIEPTAFEQTRKIQAIGPGVSGGIRLSPITYNIPGVRAASQTSIARLS